MSIHALSNFFFHAKPVEERSWYGSLGTTQGCYSPLERMIAKKICSGRPPDGGLKDKQKG